MRSNSVAALLPTLARTHIHNFITNPMILGVTQYKGGVGKTCTAIHLAAWLAGRGGEMARVVAIDSDPNQSALLWSRGGGGGHLPFDVRRLTQVAISRREAFDHTVIDTQGRPNPDDVRDLAEQCDLLVIPTTADTLGLDATLQMVRTLNALPTPPRYSVLVTMAAAGSPAATDAIAALKQQGVAVVETVIRRYEAFNRAAENGVPVYDSAAGENRDKAWSDYVAAAQALGLNRGRPYDRAPTSL